MVSVRETIVMPTAAMSSGPMSLALVQGSSGEGTPAGSTPTVSTPSSARPSRAETAVAPTTPTRTAGTRVVSRGRPRRTTRTPTPTARVAASVWSMPSTNARTSSMKSSPSVEKPNSFGSWLTMIVMARPFM